MEKQNTVYQNYNPAIEQDRSGNVCELFSKYGYTMFPQQRRIYEHLANTVEGNILEAGCGDGVGSALIERKLTVSGMGHLVATDKLKKNIDMARCLYPWVDFALWDFEEPWTGDKFGTVICVEAIEHVANPGKAINNLIEAASCDVWISTPNGKGQQRPPSNPYHVCEYTVEEILAMTVSNRKVKGITILNETFESVNIDTDCSPLVYHLLLRAN